MKTSKHAAGIAAIVAIAMIGTIVAAAIISNMITIETSVKDGVKIEYVTDKATLDEQAGFQAVSGPYEVYNSDGETLTGVRYAIGVRATVQPGDTFTGVRSYFEIKKKDASGNLVDINEGDIAIQYYEVQESIKGWKDLPLTKGEMVLSGAFGPSDGVTLTSESNGHINQFLVTYNVAGDYTINIWSVGTLGPSI